MMSASLPEFSTPGNPILPVEKWRLPSSPGTPGIPGNVPADGCSIQGEYTARYPEFFGCIVDDDPSQSCRDEFFDLSPNLCPPQYQDQTVQKRYIIPERWPVDQSVPMGRRVAFYAAWDASAEPWIMFSFDVAWRT